MAATERDGENGVGLADLDLDEPIPAERIDALPDSETLRRRRSRSELYRGLARKGLTLRELIVEHLQDRGLYRRDYLGSTLREHLGLPIPG